MNMQNINQLNNRHLTEDFTYQAFWDLAMPYTFLQERNKTHHDFLKYKVYFFQQSLEKFLKALISQYNDNKILKKYGHNFSLLFKDTVENLPQEKCIFFMENLALIGNLFLETFDESCRKDINLNFKKPILKAEVFQTYKNKLLYYEWYLQCLSFGFIDAKYPNTNDSLKQLYIEKPLYGVFYHPYLNPPLNVGTVLSCSLIMQLLNQESKSKLEKNLFDDELFKLKYQRNPNKEVKRQLQEAQTLYQYMLNTSKKYFLTQK